MRLKLSDCNILGVEDSGHLVMASPHPQGGRCLVGDGVASMLAVLCAMACEKIERKRLLKDSNAEFRFLPPIGPSGLEITI